MRLMVSVLSLFLFLWSGTALAACYEPRPPTAPSKGLKPNKPRPPYCMGSTNQRSNCSEAELRQYDQEIGRYNRSVEDYAHRLRQFAADANRYANEASKYANCEIQESNR